MERVELTRRAVLQTAVAALCVETGYLSVEKHALGSLTEATQSFISELGRTARMYSELASRTEPTVSDVHSALIDSGFDVNGLSEYSKRPQRRHLAKQPRSYPQPQPRCLQVGSKCTRPSNIPQHLPLLPDPHTYVKTPTFIVPASDYKSVREKLAVEKCNSRRALSTLLSKTRPSHPVAGTSDSLGLYTVVTSEMTVSPSYMQALLLSTEEQEGVNDDHTPHDPPGDLDPLHSEERSELTETNTSDSYENPFLKPAKQVKITILNRPTQ